MRSIYVLRTAAEAPATPVAASGCTEIAAGALPEGMLAGGDMMTQSWSSSSSSAWMYSALMAVE
eukprot:3052-Eustigmatos_ZCMA.PRE.1